MGIREWFSRRQSSAPDDLPAAIGFSVAPGLDVIVRGQVRDAHAAAGPIRDVPPPPIRGRQYKIIDVAGTKTRDVASSWHFEDTLRSMPFGPVLVTLRFEPNEANPYGISAYVNGQQVGWLGTDWTADDPQVKWMMRLDAAGILPRFQGLHRLTGNTREHIINFDFPGRGRYDEPLDDIAGRIIGEVSGSG
ncbi:MAG: hypothetical protein WBW75_03995 [Mycobacterium sp.]|uniref:hypothetical protein n=1 Tax=Mycobacterium sp. TaxID=1785 RepID=UPI003C6AA71A